MQLNVLYQFNEKYAPFAGTSITSLFENNREIEEINVYILGENLSDDSQKKLFQLAEIYERKLVFKETTGLIDKMKKWGIPAYRGSYAANMRLFLPLILEEEIERILYLDADTIVNGNLKVLLELEMKDAALGMVMDSLGGNHKRVLGFNEEEPYYNSGVILFNLKNWRACECTERIIEHIKQGNTDYSAPDQDLLNVVCKDSIMTLPPRFNVQPVHLVFDSRDYYKCYGEAVYYSEEELKTLKEEALIYHFFRFLGEFPWNKNNLHPDNQLFDQYIALSPWKDYEKQKAENTFPMKVEKILFKILPHSVFLRIFYFFHNIYIEKKREI